MTNRKPREIVHYEEQHTMMYQIVTVNMNEKVLKEMLIEHLIPNNKNELIQAYYVLKLSQELEIEPKTYYGAWNASIGKVNHLYIYEEKILDKLKNNITPEELFGQIRFIDKLLGLSKKEVRHSLAIKESIFEKFGFIYKAPREIIAADEENHHSKNVLVLRTNKDLLVEILLEDLTNDNKKELIKTYYITKLAESSKIKNPGKDTIFDNLTDIKELESQIINKLKNSVTKEEISKEIKLINIKLNLSAKEKFDSVILEQDFIQTLGMKRPVYKL